MKTARTICALLVCGAAGVGLPGCGMDNKPQAGRIPANSSNLGRAQVDDPRTPHLKCLRQKGIKAKRVGLTTIEVDGGPKIVFAPTAGAAQELQIDGGVTSAEVIGQALLYPGDVKPGKLKTVEDCMTNYQY